MSSRSQERLGSNGWSVLLRALLWLIIAVQIALIGVSLVLSALALPPDVAGMAEPFAFGVVTLSFPAVGGIILARRPAHPVGWILGAMALGWALANAGGAYARYALLTAPGALPGGEWALWMSGDSWNIVLSQGLLLLLLLIFPTGEIPSGGWRWVAWGVAVWTVICGSVTALAPGPLDDMLGLGLVNPAGASDRFGSLLTSLAPALRLGFVVLFTLSASSLIVRFRGSRGIERQQLKWIALAAGVASLLVAATLTGLAVMPDDTFDPPLLVAGALSPGLLPVAIGMAMLRHRLYEIDRIISRTMSYTLLIALLGLVFFGLVTALTMVVSSENDLVIAGSTLAVAALFNPLRTRVQSWVDRRFNRTRYVAHLVVERLAGSLRGQVDPDGVVDRWVRVVSDTIHPSFVTVWLRPPVGEADTKRHQTRAPGTSAGPSPSAALLD